MEKTEEIFNRLYAIDLTGKTEEKIGLTYLSWANAWAVLKKNYPSASYTIYTRTQKMSEEKTITDSITGISKVIRTESESELPYFTDGNTCFVKVGVTINGLEYIEYLPVMDNRNNSIDYSVIKSVSINKAIQRAFVKACARHGLGLYIYEGEDLPESKRLNKREIVDKVEKLKCPEKTQVFFNKLQTEVVNFLRENQASLSEQSSQFLVEYGTRAFQGKKVTEVTFDEDSVEKMYHFRALIEEIKKYEGQ